MLLICTLFLSIQLLGDEKKRARAPTEGELERKKPKIAEDSRSQGEEPESGGIENSSL